MNSKKKQDGEKQQLDEHETRQVEEKRKRHVRKANIKEARGGKKKEVEVREKQRQFGEENCEVGDEKQRQFGNQENRWSEALGRLYHALTEQRWEEAYVLLPCVLLQPSWRLPDNLLWKVINVVSLNAHSVPSDLRDQLKRQVCGLHVPAEEVVLDSLPQLAPTFNSDHINELHQFLDYFGVHDMVLAWEGKERLKEICEAIMAKVDQHKWMSSYSDETEIQHTLFGSSSKMDMSEARRLGIHLKKPYVGLEEPAEWLLLSVLMQECQVHGPDKATATLDTHLSAYPQRPSALRLALYCYRTFLPTPVWKQMELLKTLVTVCPSDPRVLEYIDHLLKERGGRAVDGNNKTRSAIDSNSDSGLDEQGKGSILAAPIGSCFLKSEERVSTLFECVEMLVNLLHFQEFVWELKPWAKLTELLSCFYTSWLRCWSCGLCKGSRKRVCKMTKLDCLVLQYLVWQPPSAQLSQDKAKVLVHHVFAAHVFCHYNKRYLKVCRRVIRSVGLDKTLDNLLFPPNSDSSLHAKFLRFVQKKHPR